MAMSILFNPHSAHAVKFIMSIVLVMASVTDMTGQDDCSYDLNGDGFTASQ